MESGLSVSYPFRFFFSPIFYIVFFIVSVGIFSASLLRAFIITPECIAMVIAGRRRDIDSTFLDAAWLLSLL